MIYQRFSPQAFNLCLLAERPERYIFHNRVDFKWCNVEVVSGPDSPTCVRKEGVVF